MTHLGKWNGRSVLVVDDSATNRFLAVQMLKELGIERILEADNGTSALAVMNATVVDLLLTDLNMPGMDGVELLSALAKSPQKFACFVGVMSDVGQSVLGTVESIAEESRLELLGVFPKPLNIESLRKLLGERDPDLHEVVKNLDSLKFSAGDGQAALDAGELVPYFQPKVRVADLKPCGMEALVRWIHPVHAVLPPYVFVYHLETGDIAMQFYLYFLEEVCKFLSTLPADARGLHCSVNLPVPLLEQESLVDDMARIVASYGLPNRTIVVELTETSLMLHLADSLSTLARLRMKGFGIAMDDYGTGYSSMKQLARCPFTELKIDREFVNGAASSDKKLAIFNSAIVMCQKLNLVSVAEGVETQADWDLLVSGGCDVAQGYLVSRPIPGEAMLEWLQTHL